MFVKGNTVEQKKLKGNKSIEKENGIDTIPILPDVRKNKTCDCNSVKKNVTANQQYAYVYPELSISGVKSRCSPVQFKAKSLPWGTLYKATLLSK